MGPDDEIQVLVVGAGVGGLALAGFLDRAGLDPIVVDRAENLDGAGGILELQPDAMTALSWLGVADAVRDAGTVVDSWTLRAADGTVRRRLAVDGGGLVGVEYGRLRARLADAVPDATIRTGTALDRVDDGRGSSVVEFENGVREPFDVVVGADGVRSRTRECLGGPDPAFRGTVSLAAPLEAAPDRAGATEHWSPDGPVLGVVPAGERAWGWLTLPAADPGEVTAPRSTVAEAVRSIDWFPVEALPDSDREIAVAADFRVEPAILADGRVALLGDAAHARHRLSGLGPTLAIADAAALAEELTTGRGSPVDRLDAYASRRRSRLRELADPGPAGPLAAAAAAAPETLSDVARIRGGRLARSFSDDPPSPEPVPRHADSR